MHYRDYETGGGVGRRERQQTNSRKRTETDPILKIDRHGQRDRLISRSVTIISQGFPFMEDLLLFLCKEELGHGNKRVVDFLFPK